jgi:hypothetical protein
VSSLKKYKVVNLPFPGRVDLFGFGEVKLHQLTDKQADEIHAAGVAKKHLIPVADLPSPEAPIVKPKRQKRNQEFLS